MQNKRGNGTRNIVLQANGKSLKEYEAAKIIVSEFTENFSTTVTSEPYIAQLTVEFACSLTSLTCSGQAVA